MRSIEINGSRSVMSVIFSGSDLTRSNIGYGNKVLMLIPGNSMEKFLLVCWLLGLTFSESNFYVKPHSLPLKSAGIAMGWHFHFFQFHMASLFSLKCFLYHFTFIFLPPVLGNCIYMFSLSWLCMCVYIPMYLYLCTLLFSVGRWLKRGKIILIT